MFNYLISSPVFLRVMLSHSSLSLFSDLTKSYNLGISLSRVELIDSMISDLILVSTEISAFKKLDFSSKYLKITKR